MNRSGSVEKSSSPAAQRSHLGRGRRPIRAALSALKAHLQRSAPLSLAQATALSAATGVAAVILPMMPAAASRPLPPSGHRSGVATQFPLRPLPDPIDTEGCRPSANPHVVGISDEYLSSLPQPSQTIARLECKILALSDIGQSRHNSLDLQANELRAELREQLGAIDPQEASAFDDIVQHFLRRAEEEGLPIALMPTVVTVRKDGTHVDDIALEELGSREFGPVIAWINRDSFLRTHDLAAGNRVDLPDPESFLAIRAHLKAGQTAITPTGNLIGEMPRRSSWTDRPNPSGVQGLVVGKNAQQQWEDYLDGVVSLEDVARLDLAKVLLERKDFAAADREGYLRVFKDMVRADQYERILPLITTSGGNALEGSAVVVQKERSWEALSYRVYGTSAFGALLRHFNRAFNEETTQLEWAALPEEGRVIRAPAPIIAVDSVLRRDFAFSRAPLELAGEYRLPPEVRGLIKRVPEWHQQAALQLVARMVAFPEQAQPEDAAILREYLGEKTAGEIMKLVEEAQEERRAGSPRATDSTTFSLKPGDTFWDIGREELGSGRFGSQLLQRVNPSLKATELPDKGVARSVSLMDAALMRALVALGLATQDPVSGELSFGRWAPQGLAAA
jgi:hypothetical protein